MLNIKTIKIEEINLPKIVITKELEKEIIENSKKIQEKILEDLITFASSNY